MASKQKRMQPRIRQLLLLGLAVIAMYVVLPQLGNFRHSLSLLTSAHWPQLVWACAFTAASYCFAAGTYKLLAFHLIGYARTVFVQLAGMFVNRLLPAGIGGMGVNYAYLRKNRHTGTEAASVVAVNNALGIVGHVLLLTALLLLFRDNLPHPHLSRTHDSRLIGLFIIILVAVWLIFYRQYKQRIKQTLQHFLRQVYLYRKRPARLSAALACSIGLTMCNVLSLWFCVLALNVSMPFIAVLVVFSLGILFGTAAPTPGGLGGVEAGLVAGFVVYHVDSALALAIVLLYRLLSYWLPLFVGAAAFVVAERKRYI